ncbi:lectin BRA-3 [Biomphalaria pfeifferi]|uniref:Lectin BRA-3 n=1 Tax=Biomphalaria pfeifferi TaxID=112525 RepID=A0AAD8BMY0_BIOPF|nr:lectin BRA-3 [Biomphalaria pfeifferi]
MVHVRLTNTLFLFSYLILVIKCVDSMFCNPRMTYHRHSHSCMTVVNGARTHDEANQYCAQHFSGHLVYIFDEETNNFTKYLLPNYDPYHIGLNDKDQNGVYKWGNGQVANYTDFQKQQKSNEGMKFVIMYKVSWSESFNSECKFICQTNAENEFFFLNSSDFENKTVETTAQTKTVWNCGYVREEHRLELLYLKNDGTILHLRNIFGTDLKHEMTTDCNSSGVYICRITNKLTGNVSNLEGILKVKCDATNCSDKNSNIKLLVADHSGCTEGKFCLFMYPKYTQEKVHNVERKVPIKKPKYSIGFTYTNEINTKGELVIKFCNVTSSDYGGYVISLWNNVKTMSTLYFTITGPPQCPKNLTSEVLDHNLVKLTWSPISHKILKQKFIIFRTDKGGDVNIGTVLEQNETLMSYNVTGLSVNINYSFFLKVESGQSKIECRNLTTIVLIQEKEAQEGQPFDANNAFYIIPIVASVGILAVIVVIIVLVKKRKKTNNKTTFTDQKGFKYNCGSETISTQQSSQNNDNFSANTLDPVCSTEVAENIYNNVLEHNAQQGAKVLKPARKSGSSVKLKDKVSMATGKKQAATLPLGKTLVTWDDEKEDVNVYENAREDTLNQVQELKDNEYNDTPSNEKKLPLQEPDGEASKPKEDSRTISPEGLVYVSVEINRSGPQIVVEKPKVEEMLDKKQTQDKEQKAVKPSYEAVEYSSLDYLATSVAATKDDVGGLDTEELKNE